MRFIRTIIIINAFLMILSSNLRMKLNALESGLLICESIHEKFAFIVELSMSLV